MFFLPVCWLNLTAVQSDVSVTWWRRLCSRIRLCLTDQCRRLAQCWKEYCCILWHKHNNKLKKARSRSLYMQPRWSCGLCLWLDAASTWRRAWRTMTWFDSCAHSKTAPWTKLRSQRCQALVGCCTHPHSVSMVAREGKCGLLKACTHSLTVTAPVGPRRGQFMETVSDLQSVYPKLKDLFTMFLVRFLRISLTLFLH